MSRSPLDERTTIDQLISSNPLTLGDKAHLISATWLSLWRCYTSPDEVASPPGAIDNSALLDDDGILKVGLTEQTHYSVFSTPVWSRLFDWYGGGPDVAVDCYLNNDKQVTASATYFNVRLVYESAEKPLKANNYEKIGDLRIRALRTCSLSDDTDSQLVDYFAGRFNSVMDDAQIVQHYHVLSNQQLLLNTRNQHHNWRHSKPPPPDQFGHSFHHYSAPKPVAPWIGPGVCGLRNLGNSCYLNSGLQCLLHTEKVAAHFLKQTWRLEINHTNKLGTHGVVSGHFAGLVKSFYEGRTSVVDPSDLKKSMGQFAGQFQGFQQHDSHELLMYLLDAIHEDLNRCIEKPSVETVIGDENNNDETAETSWKNHKLRHDSVIVDLFHGQLRSRLKCPTCQKITVVFDPFVSIPLPLKKSIQTMTLRALFRPLSFDSVPQVVTIPVPMGQAALEMEKLVGNATGRPCPVVVGELDRPGHYEWLPPALYGDAQAVKEIQTTIFDIFEITADSGRWVPVSLKIERTGDPKNEAVVGPFLVLIPATGGIDEVLAAASECLDWLWTDKHFDLSGDALRLKSSLTLPSSASTDSGSHRFLKAPGQVDAIMSDTRCAELVPEVVAICLNPARLEGFSLDALADYLVKTRGVERPKTEQPVLAAPVMDLAQCFDLFEAEEVLDEENEWFCPHCRTFVCASKKMDLWRVPEIVMIELKRFRSNLHGITKIDGEVSYPDELELQERVIGPQRSERLKYRLYAVSEHSGSTGAGHYTAHAIVRKDGNAKWYSFNDSTCAMTTAADAHNKSAYILFYERVSEG
jgi:ubiquitin carboxyl-terminal hydrolase 4/11/15